MIKRTQPNHVATAAQELAVTNLQDIILEDKHLEQWEVVFQDNNNLNQEYFNSNKHNKH